MTNSKAKPTKVQPQKASLSNGKIFITATFNNTLVSITNNQGDVIVWGSTGASGFKGSRKSTPFAATTAIDAVIKKAKEKGLSQAEVYIKGPGSGRDAALGVIRSSGLKITQIADITPMPHNGCRPKKRRRG